MKDPYLIQRATFRKSEKSGIDSLLEFDYMGSAEFEFDALPKSLKAIRKEVNEYEKITFQIKGMSIEVFCKSEDRIAVFDFINGLAVNKYRLKEYSGFDNYTGSFPVKSYMRRVDFWWDIENNFMFWKSNEDFTKEFMERIRKKEGKAP